MGYRVGDFGARPKDGVAMMVLLWLLSCDEDPTQLPVECSDAITYETVGQPFLRNYCTGCHASSLPVGKRYGAPLAVNLDTFSGAKQYSLRSYVRAVHLQDMPAGGGVSEIDRQRFTQWALCGAIGAEIETPTVEALDRVTSFVIYSSVVAGDSEGEVILRRIVDDNRAFSTEESLLREERYTVDEESVLFLGYQEWDLDGQEVSRVSWEPALVVVASSFPTDQIVDATIEMDGVEWTEEQDWMGIQDFQGLWEIDIHERDLMPLNTQLWNLDGEEWGWRTSTTVVLSSAYGNTVSDLSWESQQFVGPNLLNVTEPFPLNTNMEWVDLWMEER